MSFTRRRFLRSGAITILSAGLVFRPGVLAFGQDAKRPDSARGLHPIPLQAQQESVFNYTRATFEPYIGGVFTTRGVGGGTVELTLVAVRDWNPKPKSKLRVAEAVTSRADCFSLVFRASDNLPELTTIYRLEHGALGAFDLFMTRSEDPQGQIFYEAVINHVAP
ncbi:MAG: hypothetical protein DMF67_18325 [Acidobacteria bacterium]|nr:MAG: hypothetical protein DMF67_18325 [Acidobacteriota bacterium]